MYMMYVSCMQSALSGRCIPSPPCLRTLSPGLSKDFKKKKKSLKTKCKKSLLHLTSKRRDRRSFPEKIISLSFLVSEIYQVDNVLLHLKALLLLLLSRFSRVRLCVTPETTAHQPPPSLGFSRQEHWSQLPFPSPMHESEKVKVKSLSRV